MKNVVTMFDVPRIITASYYDSVDSFSREAIWQLCYRDLSDYRIELSSISELTELCFNTQTKFSDAWQAQAEMVLQDGKINLLNGGTLTGKGIKAAVIDRPINKDHAEFENRIEYIEFFPDNPGTQKSDFHGMACASFLCGATCGVASDSSLVYFAIPNKTSNINEYYGYQLAALQKVIDYNKKSTEPIRVVSLSAPFSKEQMTVRDSLADELEKTGCVLIDASMFGRNFYGIDCIRQHENAGFILNQWQRENYERNADKEGFKDYFKQLCFVPSSRRTSASNDTNDGYIHWSKAVSESWTIPHTAGAYVLCLQACPNMTFNDFVKFSKLCSAHDGFTILNVMSIVENYQQSF